MANFYQCFVNGFSKIAALMNKLLRNNQTWEWKEKQQEAFDTLKAKFTTNPILTTPDPDQLLRVETDASDYATGGDLIYEM